MTHVHEAGIPTRTGVFAAQLASTGFTGCPDYLDGDYSWGEQFAGGAARPYTASALTVDLGRTFFLQDCDVAPKQYGSCGITHQAMEGTIDLMREHGIDHTDIASVELLVPPFADRVAPFKQPTNGEQSKFSIIQGVAAILVDGIPELPFIRPFSDETCHDPRYAAARTRVTLLVEGNRPSERAFVAQEVTLLLKDGRKFAKSVDAKLVRGHVHNPFSIEERLDMVRRTTERIGTDRTERLIAIAMDLEHHEIAEVVELIND